MRIAFIFDWHLMLQRPHHFVLQAVKSGHEAHVYTPGRVPWRRPPVPYEYATRVIRGGHRIAERLINRVMGASSPLTQRLRAGSAARSLSLCESLWNGELAGGYDAVVFCGSIPGLVSRKNQRTTLIYDCLDQCDGFPGAHPRALEFEDSLVKIADLVWAVTPGLAQRLSEGSGAGKTHIVPNACDLAHFSQPGKVRRPSKWKVGTPVIGYAGHVGAWFDWDAVIGIAKALPRALIWIIGPHRGNTQRALPSNIVMEGFVSYEHLPGYYAGFDLGIIPFKGELLMRGVSPIKMYEYLAAGKPVVSSMMPGVTGFASPGILEIASSPADFPNICSRLLSDAGGETLKQERRKLARDHSWEARWALCESLIESSRALAHGDKEVI